MESEIARVAGGVEDGKLLEQTALLLRVEESVFEKGILVLKLENSR